MSDRLDRILTRQAVLFQTRDFEALAEYYATPLPIYSEARVATYVSKAALISGLQDLRARLDQEGVRRIAARLAARGLPRGRRLTLVADWVYHLGPNVSPRTTTVTYFCRVAPTAPAPGLLIEMIEYHREAFTTYRTEQIAERREGVGRRA